MLIALLLLLPTAAGLVTLILPWSAPRRALLVLAALGHLGLTVAVWHHRPPPTLYGWLALDALGLWFLGITSVLFVAAAIYGVGYLAREGYGQRRDFFTAWDFQNEPEAVFLACLLFFLAAMTLVTVSQHFGLLWVAIEATTLASAPLIYYHRHPRSLEAAWKYLLICSVGIALALLGNFLLAAAARSQHMPLIVGDLVRGASSLQLMPLKAAFLFSLAGYGTKMGLAPLHTWLPDAHSEAPSLVSALLSGALLNCAFLGILRVMQVCVAAGLGTFAGDLLVGFGLISMGVAMIFIIGQTDFKRLLAYSSVEHVGILALGVGLGGVGVGGSLLHAVNHSLTKASLFLVAGSLLAIYRTKAVAGVRGLRRTLPCSAGLWLAGFLAITGAPPFGTFVSELTILKAALDQQSAVAAALYLTFLTLIFVGMATIILRMVQGEPDRAGESEPGIHRERWWAVLPPLALLLGVLWLGMHLPAALENVLESAIRDLGGTELFADVAWPDAVRPP